MCEGEMLVFEMCVSGRHKRTSLCEKRRPASALNSTLALNSASLKVQFVHNLAVNDLSLCVKCVCVEVATCSRLVFAGVCVFVVEGHCTFGQESFRSLSDVITPPGSRWVVGVCPSLC